MNFALAEKTRPSFEAGESSKKLKKALGRRYFPFFKHVLLGVTRDLAERRSPALRETNLDAISRFNLEDLISGEELSFTSLNGLAGGSFYKVRFHVMGDPVVFAKLYADKKSYETAKSVQDIAAVLSPNVEPVRYFDDKKRLIATPFINGNTLADELKEAEMPAKLQFLEGAIDVLAGLYISGNREKFKGVKLAEITDATDSMLQKFIFQTIPSLKVGNTRFGKPRVRDNDLTHLLNFYKSEIGRSLDETEHNRLIHGDAHPGNFIVADGKTSLIDFDLARIGKIHTDLFKLFEKSGVLSNPFLKSRLLDYAYSAVSGVYPDKEQFMTQYRDTETHEFLVSAGRYHALANNRRLTKDPAKKKELYMHACFYYTRALENMKQSGQHFLAESLEKLVDSHFTEGVHKLSDLEMNQIRHSPDDSMLSSILGESSLTNQYARANSIISGKVLEARVKAGFGLLGKVAAVALAVGIGFGMYNNFSGKDSAEQQARKDQDLMQTSIEQYIQANQKKIHATVIYRDDIRNISKDLGDAQYSLFNEEKGYTYTIYNQADFKRLFFGSGGTLFSPSIEVYFADQVHTNPEALRSLVLATGLKTTERKMLLEQGRRGTTLLSNDQLNVLGLSFWQTGKDATANGAEENDSILFAGRALNYYLMQNGGEVYSAFAAYFLGQDAVNQATTRAGSKDINQFYIHLPDGPEKKLLAYAMHIHETNLWDEQQRFFHNTDEGGKEFSRMMFLSRNFGLKWEYNTRDRTFPGAKEVLKTAEYAKMLEKYSDRELAYVAVHDERLVEQVIAMASNGGYRSPGAYFPASLMNKIGRAFDQQIDAWASYW